MAEKEEQFSTESVDVVASMKELRNVVKNIDELTLEDIQKELKIAYKIGLSGTPEGESEEKFASELESIISELNKKATELKKNSENVVSVNMKDMETRQSESETVVEEKQPEPAPVVEKTIPRPQFDEPASETVNESTDLNSIVLEETETEIVDKETVPSVKHSESVAEIKPNEPISKIENAEMDSVPKQTPIKSPNKHVEQEEEKKESLVITEPVDENKMNIIVDKGKSDSNQTDTKKDEKSKREEEILDDINDVFTVKPFDGDDDETSNVEHDKVDTNTEPEQKEQLDIQTKDDVERERIKKLDEEYVNAPKDVNLCNVKSVSRKKISDILKALSKLDTTGVNVQNVEMFDFDLDNADIRKEYFKTRNDMIAAPKISRIALLMSGHYEEIAAYGNSDMISVERTIFSESYRFVDKERILFESIYSHVNYVSYAKEKPDFDTWAKNIKYPDAMSLYFGVYDANSTGPNHYIFDCPYCGEELSINRRNPDLTVGVPKEMNLKDLEEFITNKELMNVDSTPLAKWAKTTTVRKMLPNSCIIVDFAVPTVYEYLEAITTLEKINQRDMGGRLNLSILDEWNVDPDEIEDQEAIVEDYERIMTCIYIKDIGIPTKVGNTNSYRYIKIDNRADIIEHINALDSDDYNELLSGEPVKELITKQSTKYYLTDCKCNNEKCGKNIKYVSINPKQIFFFKIGEGRRKRLMR